MTADEMVKLINAISPVVLALIAFFTVKANLRANSAHEKAINNRKTLDKVEKALYDSPAINGPYKSGSNLVVPGIDGADIPEDVKDLKPDA